MPSKEDVADQSAGLGFKLYLLFTISYFLHLPARITFLATVRFDLALIGILFLFAFSTRREEKESVSFRTGKLLWVLFIYVVVSLPFVQWPGSVLNTGIPNLLKAVVFYYYTVSFINTEKKLKVYVAVLIACQSFRILEPLYLHQVNGYWGSATHLGGAEMMSRLSGSPYDIINPNGLAFVITSVLPFFHYLCMVAPFRFKLLYFAALPLFIYTLVLTASRTGFLALSVILAGIFFNSKNKIFLTFIVGLLAVIAFSALNDLQKERYLSIGQGNVRGSETARGRFDGVVDNFKVALNKPIVGHGLGTSLEANFNTVGVAQPAHNLFAELMQELGAIGLIIFLCFIGSIISNFRISRKKVYENPERNDYLINFTGAMGVWLIMNLFFSFASYGLSSYEWYLFAGLSVTVRRLSGIKDCTAPAFIT